MNIENGLTKTSSQARIKVLGPGCKNCTLLETHVKLALERMGKNLEVEKVTEIPQILAYGVMKTPALVVGDEVVVSGFVPSPRQIQEMLEARLA
ncbi:MAG: thioredoxin family protein [Meiothermus silvanus]|nr:thioredoxin family protein [Allomeiothermus silvanus]